MEKIVKFFNKTIVKSIVLLVIPLTYNWAFSYALTLEKGHSNKGTLILASIVFLVIHIIILIAYGKEENRMKTECRTPKDEMAKENLEIKNLIKVTIKMVGDVAESIHELILEKKGHSQIVDWKYLESKGDTICKEAFELIGKLAESGDNFSVSLMFRQEKDGKAGYTMMSRADNDVTHRPISYRNFVEEKDASGYFYKTIFDKAPTRPVILMNKKEIKKKFKDAEVVPYAQYIGLPIVCKNNRVVGLLQIVAYGDSVIASDRGKIQNLCNNYLCMYTKLMLLEDKFENIKQCM